MSSKLRYCIIIIAAFLVFVLVLPIFNLPNEVYADTTSDVTAFVTRFYQQCLNR
ncbi:hypothetical protein LLG07_03205 [bacterium]|nr:hypothetical protein [bacterium]